MLPEVVVASYLRQVCGRVVRTVREVLQLYPTATPSPGMRTEPDELTPETAVGTDTRLGFFDL